MNLTAFHNRLAGANLDTNDLAGTILQERENEVVELNREQLSQGKKKDGSSLGTYRPLTIEQRLKRGLQVGFVDLKYSGSFYRLMEFIRKGNTFDIISRDWKWDMLADKYGEIITGLSEDNKQVFMRNYGRRDLVHEVSARTGIPTT